MADSSTSPIGSDFTFERLHHVQLDIPAGSEELCREFWAGVLGMTELEKPPVLAARGGCWFRGGGVEVHLGVVPDFTPSAKGHPGILVAALPALAARLESHGVPVVWDDNFPGYRRFHSADRLGNRLEFLEPTFLEPTATP
ncbi:glyoxalase [Kitasatospora sp. MAP5-34]|uniref:glyoxalase n=1 Tax=Kitasatospora sp. MAP5-34 TaxID=3035102 RepID=UPI0024743C78|nr:glyoxalase [Kitasatospora sp. MAP5-34]MDH6575455.1 catechol 2,3-dioxygenase-like lactoylglutathione lyase family enzyme [Kitasatospora sp. MAP5-34]